MRNIHLGLGLVFVLMALVFAASSMVIIYRPLLNTKPVDTETTVKLSPDAAASPRAAARLLMTSHGIRGDLRQAQERAGRFHFQIARPGEMAEVVYEPSSGEAKIKTRRQGALETLVHLHTNHGLWHEYMPSNFWAAIALLTSIGLLLLGVSGIYLWFQLHNERLIGGILLGFGLIFGFVTLLLTRLQQ
ncbi:MAG: PepSY-associated TM helix domain-containing protein [Bryobacteraceae bacterium]